ncbi:DUF397 domain-containing protein [Nocardiopsis sp. NPDC006938]|uniref:DUF397 domain-containing protein n=1 Tax=Nocardiopsis sp. NPDC006938 TaxID=3364337 RepID=UPI0036BAFB88
MGLNDGWKKSSYSHGNGGNCVEAKATGEGAAVRDTQNRHLGHLEASQSEWSAFLGVVRAK